MALAVGLTAAIMHSKAIKRLNALHQQLDAASAELREIEFEKENAEQSVSILEQELQRKISQLSDAKQQLNAANAAAAAAATTPAAPSSPRISAVQSVAQTNAVTSPFVPRNLPPAPQQLVERFLDERNHVAISREEVQGWLKLEEEYGLVMRQKHQLEAELASKEAEVKAKEEEVEALTAALEQHRKQARAAKQALLAVRAAAAEAKAAKQRATIEEAE